MYFVLSHLSPFPYSVPILSPEFNGQEKLKLDNCFKLFQKLNYQYLCVLGEGASFKNLFVSLSGQKVCGLLLVSNLIRTFARGKTITKLCCHLGLDIRYLAASITHIKWIQFIFAFVLWLLQDKTLLIIQAPSQILIHWVLSHEVELSVADVMVS